MIVAGFGFRSGATPESLLDAFARAGGRADRVATLAGKADLQAFRVFAAQRQVTTVLPEDARQMQTLTRSEHSQSTHQTGSVAEACALAAAGPGAMLLGARAISSDRMATCALARSRHTGDDT